MVDVSRLEGLGRMIMDASVEAEYLDQRRVVGSLDDAFAAVLRVLADERVRAVKEERRVEEELVREE
ncbi:hypothetical protein ES703_103839 [subsurface metagenome]